MRKLIISILSIIMICSCASAAQWADGCSPENPYGVDNTADFSQTIGWMLCDPLPGSVIDYDVHSVSVYLPREDVEKGSATLYINKKDGTPVMEIELTDSNFLQYTLEEDDLAQLSWGCGSVFTIELGTVLEPGTDYVVQISEGFVVDPVRKVNSAAIAGKDKWTFATAPARDNRVECMYAYRAVATEADEENGATDAPVEALTEEEAAEVENSEGSAIDLTIPEDALLPGAALSTGDTVHFVVRMGKGITACIVVEEGEMDASETWLEEDCEVELTLTQAGSLKWDILWLDESGTVVDSDYFDYVVE